MTLEQGLHLGVPMDVYLSDPCPEPSLSAGCIKTILGRSLEHARAQHPRLGARTDRPSRAADRGSAAHELLLGGSQAIVWGDPKWGDWRSKAAREYRDAARAQGRTPMLDCDREPIQRMVEIAEAKLDGYLPGVAEATMIWQRGETWCRARPDWLTADHMVIVDYKTTTDAEPMQWERRAMRAGGYDISAAHYLDGLDHLFGECERRYLFLVQETEPPYACSWVGVGPEHEELARAKVAWATMAWSNAVAEQKWPSYDEGIYWTSAPDWMVAEWEHKTGQIAEPITFGGEELF